MHRFLDTFDVDLAHVVEHEVPVDHRRGALRQVGLARLRQRLHPRRKAHGVPDRRIRHDPVGADVADHHLTRVEAHPDRQAEAVVAPHRAGEALQAIAEEQRRVAGTGGVILVCDGRAEEHHRAVAGELVDRAVEAVHALGDEREEPVHQGAPRLVVDAPGELHRALHVDEHDGDLLALALQGRRGRDDLVLDERWPHPLQNFCRQGSRYRSQRTRSWRSARFRTHRRTAPRQHSRCRTSGRSSSLELSMPPWRPTV